MQWVSIKDYLIPLDKVLYIRKGRAQEKFLIFIKFEDEEIYCMFDTEQERDDEYQGIWEMT